MEQKTTHIVLADNQDITRAGMMYVCSQLQGTEWRRATDKAGLMAQLCEWPDATVVLDYSLFDINDVDELQVLHARFPQASWVLFCFDLTADFVRRTLALGNSFSVLLKDSPLEEVFDCLHFASQRRSYICQRMSEILFSAHQETEEDVKLTPTETEILKDIALGMTTREIAERRVSSFHTVNTHRKNIFRKLGVNNAHEATKYALRAGLIDAAEYYI